MILDQVYNAIKRVGAPVVITRTVFGTVDPVTGEAPSTVASVDTYGALDASSLKTLGFKYGDGLVQSGDLIAMLPAKGLSFEPSAGDTILLRGSLYTVKMNQPTYYGSTVVKHDCLVRG